MAGMKEKDDACILALSRKTDAKEQYFFFLIYWNMQSQITVVKN